MNEATCFMTDRLVSFAKLRDTDLPRLRAWLSAAHVQEWWGDAESEMHEIESHLANRKVEMFVFSLDAQPTGYIQCYDPRDWPGHGFDGEAPGTRGIDLFIGEPDMIGRGVGTAVIRAFCDRLFARGAPAVVIDPDPANARAIRTYEKAGFRAFGRFSDPESGELLLMRCVRRG